MLPATGNPTGPPPLVSVKQVEVLGDLAPGLFTCCVKPMVDQFILERSQKLSMGAVS
jgi:hypothetical protein